MAAAHDISTVTVRDILYVAFKYKIQIVATFFAALLGALGYLLYVGPTYEAKTNILVQLGREKTEAVEMSATKPNAVFGARSEDIRDEIEILKDKNAVNAVMPRLQDWIDNAPHPPMSLVRRIRTWVKDGVRWLKELAYQPLYALELAARLTPSQRFALSLVDALDAQLIEETDVIGLKFSWSDPEFAAYAANAFAEEYVRRRTDVYATDDAQRFYSDQIKLYQGKLAGIEHEIERYRETKSISNLDVQRELVLKDISQLEREFNDVGGALKDLQVKLDAVYSRYVKSDAWLETPIIAGIVPDMTALDKRYFDTLADHNRLLDTNTPQSRSVQALNTQLAKLRDQKFRVLDGFIQSHKSGLTKRQEFIAATLVETRKSLAALDQSARTLRDMERQRDLIEHDYKEYSNKAEDFRISAALNKQRLSSVKILGPALPPEKPDKPWVSVVMGLAALVGLFLGFAYATISEYFDHGLRDKEDVESALGVPLLAVVPDAKYGKRAVGGPAGV